MRRRSTCCLPEGRRSPLISLCEIDPLALRCMVFGVVLVATNMACFCFLNPAASCCSPSSTKEMHLKGNFPSQTTPHNRRPCVFYNIRTPLACVWKKILNSQLAENLLFAEASTGDEMKRDAEWMGVASKTSSSTAMQPTECLE